MLVATLIGAATGTARADSAWPSSVEVHWTAPPACPTEDAVRAAIFSLLRASSNAATGAPLWFAGSVAQAEGRFRMDVQTRSPSGGEAKSVVGESCATLADAFALIVAFTIDPHLSGAEPPHLSGVDAPRAAPAGGAPIARETPPAVASPLGRESPAPRWAIGAVGLASAGHLPFLGLGVGPVIAVGVRPRWELAGVVWPGQERTLTESQGTVGVRVNLLAARPSVCVPLSAAGGALALCAGVEVGRMQGTGTGLASDTGQSWWLSVGAGVAARTPLGGGFDLRVRFDLGVPVFRPAFVVERPAGPRELWQPSALFAVLSLSPELALSSTDRDPPGHNR